MPNIHADDARQTDILKVESVRDVCAYFLGISALPPEQRLNKETEWGYKSKCVRLLQKLCSVSERRVRAWGKGLDFTDIPPIRLAQLTILLLRNKLVKAHEQVRQRDEEIQRLQRLIDVLQFRLQNARKSA